MALQDDWDTLVAAFTVKWPEALAQPALTPVAPDRYKATIWAPDGPLSVEAADPGVALAALADDISGAQSQDVRARVLRLAALQRKAEGGRIIAEAQAEIDALSEERN
jgi:hypothetical protein